MISPFIIVIFNHGIITTQRQALPINQRSNYFECY